jgi:hypothetical protein
MSSLLHSTFNGEGFYDLRTVQEICNMAEPNYSYPSKHKYKMLKKENNITNCQ